MLRRAYDWCIAAAHRPYALWLMGFVSFVESSFFPVPPDVMLIPMSLAQPKRAWTYATVCTLTSVAGGVLGYGIGALLYDSVGHWLISLYGYGDKVEAFREAYARWGTLIISGCSLYSRLWPAACGFIWWRSCSAVTEKSPARSLKSASPSGSR